MIRTVAGDLIEGKFHKEMIVCSFLLNKEHKCLCELVAVVEFICHLLECLCVPREKVLYKSVIIFTTAVCSVDLYSMSNCPFMRGLSRSLCGCELYDVGHYSCIVAYGLVGLLVGRVACIGDLLPLAPLQALVVV